MTFVAASFFTPGTGCTYLYCARGVHGVLRVGLMASQLDVPPLTLLSVAGCGRLQLGVADWATSVALLQVVYI